MPSLTTSCLLRTMQLHFRVKEHWIAGREEKKAELKRKSLDVSENDPQSDMERWEARKRERGLKTWRLIRHTYTIHSQPGLQETRRTEERRDSNEWGNKRVSGTDQACESKRAGNSTGPHWTMNLCKSLPRLIKGKLQNGQTQKGDFKENKKKKRYISYKERQLDCQWVLLQNPEYNIFKAKEQTLSAKHNAHLLLRMSGRQNFEISIMYRQENEQSKVVRGLSFSWTHSRSLYMKTNLIGG